MCNVAIGGLQIQLCALSCIDIVLGSSQAAHMLMRQQHQQQCQPASRKEMETLVAELESSIRAASDAHSAAGACADVDHFTIIGLFELQFVTCLRDAAISHCHSQVVFSVQEEWRRCFWR